MAVAFDTLTYARRLWEAGIPQEQAEVHAEALAAAVTETLATKTDLRELAAMTKQDYARVGDQSSISPRPSRNCASSSCASPFGSAA